MSQNSVTTRADSIREHELYRYFKPPSSDITESSKPEESTLSVTTASSPDTTLTALAQLCAIRLSASRSMISVIDREKQYFIAEATKTIRISDTSKSEEEGDGLWAGCSTVDKAGRLCEKTIDLPVSVGKAPCFTVTDLSTDERFNELPFVTGPPHFRFYAGTPLTTRKGINIGSLFILDDKIRPHLTPGQEEFLGTMAQTVMKHMEITSEAEERKKVTRMSMGLNAFVEGKSQVGHHGIPLSVLKNEQLKHVPDSGTTKDSSLGLNHAAADASPRAHQKRTQYVENRSERLNRRTVAAEIMSKNGQEQRPATSSHHGGRQSALSELSEDSDASSDDFDTGLISADSGHRATCARAANLLSESLDLNGPPRRGGVVFFDTTSRLGKQDSSAKHKSESTTSSTTSQNNAPTKTESRPADIISQSADEGSFTPIKEDVLFDFLRRFPHGKLWTFDVDGIFSSSDDDPTSPLGNKRFENIQVNRAQKRQTEAKLLQNHFPGCRQLLFTGVWDAATSRWFLGGFAWTTSSSQIFSTHTELNFFRAFGNSVTAEVSRLASIAADRQKADFIGSISHEFRSPLHGILASAEFLMDTNTDAFQKSLVDTVLSCGRTLLDTINHILDYSKINSFERTWRNVRKPAAAFRRSHNHHRGGSKRETPPMLSIYASTNVASVTEEVVEGVYVGQIYQDISSTDTTDLSLHGKKQARGQGLHVPFDNTSGRDLVAKPVDVILDIPYDDYTFITQPGALKRVVMNIFGNALKYTQRGSITVHLSLDPDESPHGSLDQAVQERTLQIKVTDTGKGISKEYIRTSLFNPFCQEDVLASGTGLGLSIVKSIVTMLNGTIDIQSELGVGTEVIVRLPLSRIPGTETPVDTPPSALTDQSQDESIARLSEDHGTTKVSLYGFEADLQQIGQIVKRYIEEWYGLMTMTGLPGPGPEHADLVILDERVLPMYLERRVVERPVLVFCGTHTIRPETKPHLAAANIIEYVSKPFGPHKLAKGIYECLHGDRIAKRAPPSTSPTFPNIADREVEPRLPDLMPMTLETDQGNGLIEVETNETVTAVATDNARKALGSDVSSSATSTSGSNTITEERDFPFPFPQDANQTKKGNDSALVSRQQKPQLVRRATTPLIQTLPIMSISGTSKTDVRSGDGHQLPIDIAAAKGELLFNNQAKVASLPFPKIAKIAPTASGGLLESKAAEKRSPRLLLVDDNKINLRLLETFMKKRKYEVVDSAENGQLAVAAAASRDQGYDIIFMDISMPVMNGFEATRVIREMEEEVRSKAGEATFAPALIIALTGLASGRDQTEAFTSGVDLFMTKPVSFKEVGRLLDNWEQHGGLMHDGDSGVTAE